MKAISRVLHFLHLNARLPANNINQSFYRPAAIYFPAVPTNYRPQPASVPPSPRPSGCAQTKARRAHGQGTDSRLLARPAFLARSQVYISPTRSAPLSSQHHNPKITSTGHLLQHIPSKCGSSPSLTPTSLHDFFKSSINFNLQQHSRSSTFFTFKHHGHSSTPLDSCQLRPSLQGLMTFNLHSMCFTHFKYASPPSCLVQTF